MAEGGLARYRRRVPQAVLPRGLPLLLRVLPQRDVQYLVALCACYLVPPLGGTESEASAVRRAGGGVALRDQRGGALPVVGGERTNEIMFRLDRAAIASYFCVFSTVLGMQHFTARNEPRLQRLFVAASVALGMLSSGTLFLGNSFPPWLKVLILSVQSLFGTIVPIRELLTTPSSYNRMLVLTYLPLSLGCGGIGGLCFASRFPEAWGLAPRGTFDFAGHGHNLMHVFVALAAFFGYRGQTLWQNSLDCMQARAARVAVAAAKLG